MIRAALVSLALLGACTTTTEAPPPPLQPETAEEAAAADTCGMAAFTHLIGAPAAEIDPATLPPHTRIIAPDTIVTMDFAPGRLNVITGTDGIVSSLRCF